MTVLSTSHNRQGKNSRPQTNERLAYSVAEAAEVAGIGRTKLYAAIKSGDLRSTKKGGRRLVPVDALKAWLAA